MTITAPLLINSQYFLNNLNELSQIGKVGSTGVNRPSFSKADLQAREWFQNKTEEAGLIFHSDGAANVSAFLDCGKPNAKTLLLGSHLDTVYKGGRYDGALGVLAALETLRVIKSAKLDLPFHLEAISFSDEEGTLMGFLGSNALTGKLTMEDFSNTANLRGNLQEGMQRAGITPADVLSAKRDTNMLKGYLELHIEQGPNLVNQNLDIGVVTGIVGVYSCRLTYGGRADHAGTTPLPDRKDASLGAAAFILEASQLVQNDFPGCVVNCGQINFEPGGFNIVPEKAQLSLEFRSADKQQLEELKKALLNIAQTCADRYGLDFSSELLSLHEPALMDVEMQNAVEDAASKLNLKHTRMPSGAGHDAQCMAHACPTGMIFVPSTEGSHSPRETCTDRDCINGANTLLAAVLKLTGID